MPVINADGCAINVQVDGPEDAPVLMLSNSLGCTLDMWDAQVKPFTRRFRLVRYDRRGHGKSGLPPGPYTMERLARGALALPHGPGAKKAKWGGRPVGGMEGMWLGANTPERFERIVLSNTSCYYPDKNFWNDRIKAIRAAGGLGGLADRIMTLWFSKAFHERDPASVARFRAGLLATPVE